ncbi:unnamed protein product [Schistocephalus solidus]|uniref:Calmodulin n=1 Tax=Schistocephalus solidus TaxID=70667 RepID=A0A183SFK6_SCHSO|nr:unnamed protein product [Schistocephalus solidus]
MDSLDADKSGKVSATELLEALKGSGLDMDSVKDFIASIDKDGDGQLNRHELRAFFRDLAIDELMKSLDIDNSGTVSAQELLIALKGTGIDLEAVEKFIASIDKNGDGQLDRDELRAFFKEMGY